MVYISFINYTLQLQFLQVLTSFMVTFCGQLSDLWVLPGCIPCGLALVISSLNPHIISLKNSRTCRDLNPGPPQYQAGMLPTELSWLGWQKLTFTGPEKCLNSKNVKLQFSFKFSLLFFHISFFDI